MNALQPNYKMNNQNRGFTIIGIAIVLLIILILSGGYLFEREGNQPSVMQSSLQRSRNAAYAANKNVLRGQIQIFQFNNPNQPVSAEALREKNMTVPDCPECDWIILPNGEVYSTIEPPPSDESGDADSSQEASGSAGSLLEQARQYH